MGTLRTVLIPVCGQPHKAVLTQDKGVTYRERRYATCHPITLIQDSRDRKGSRAVEKTQGGIPDNTGEEQKSLGEEVDILKRGDGMTNHTTQEIYKMIMEESVERVLKG